MSAASSGAVGAQAVDALDGAVADRLPAENAAVGTQSRLAALAGRLHFGALLLVLAMSPFEAGYPPLGRFLWATYTNLEITLFLLAIAWLFRLAVDSEARRRVLHLPLLLPIVALVGAAVVSTALGEYRSLGVQFIYRLLMGVLVFASVWEALRGKRRMLVALGTFVGAGALAAIIGLLEFAPWINIQPLLRAFKPQPTTVGGLLRLTGTFEYANGAAMYFELAMPVLVSLAVLFSSRRLVDGLFKQGLDGSRRRAAQVLFFVLAGVFMLALILTLSRAAWASVAVAPVVFGIAAWARRSEPGRWVMPAVLRPLGVAVVIMALGTLYIYVTHPLFRLRLMSENDQGWYKNTITPGAVPTLTASDLISVPVTLRNDGPMTWRSDRVPIVHLSYHWLSSDKSSYTTYDGVRTTLPGDVGPGESVTVDALLEAPATAGEYYLEWDLVQEDYAWFYEKSKSRPPATLQRIEAATAARPSRTPFSAPQRPVRVRSIEEIDNSTVPRGALWRAAFAMFRDHPITGVGPDGFRNLYGKYAGVTTWNKNIYTNNTYIEMFTNLGILGGLSFLWLVGLWLVRAGRNVLRGPVGAPWVIGLGATASIVAFLVHGLGDYFLFSTPIYVVFWFLLAVSVSWPRLTDESALASREVV